MITCKWNRTLTNSSQQGIGGGQLEGVWWALQVWTKVWWHHKSQALSDQTSDLKCYIQEDDSSHTLAITLRFKTLFSVRHEVPLCPDTYMLHVFCTQLSLLLLCQSCFKY